MDQDQDLADALNKRLAEKYGSAEQEPETAEQKEVEQEAPEQPKGLRAAFLSKGLDVADDLDEEQIAEQVAERLQRSEEQARELEALRQQVEELRAFQATQKPTEEPKKEEPKTVSTEHAEAIHKWQKVEVPEELHQYVDYKDGKYQPKANFGAHGVDAAKKLNDAARERSRRADLLTNDLDAALQESGVLSAIDSKIQQTIELQLKAFDERLKDDLTRKEREAIERQQRELEEASAKAFMDERKAEFFKLNAKGEVVRDALNPGQVVLTEAGKRVRQIAEEIMREEGIEDNNKALRLACKMYDREKVVKQVEPKKTEEDKKRAFIDKGRVSSSQRQAVAERDDDIPVTAGRVRLRDIVAASQEV
jgi:hypothetical protein